MQADSNSGPNACLDRGYSPMPKEVRMSGFGSKKSFEEEIEQLHKEHEALVSAVLQSP